MEEVAPITPQAPTTAPTTPAPVATPAPAPAPATPAPAPAVPQMPAVPLPPKGSIGEEMGRAFCIGAATAAGVMGVVLVAKWLTGDFDK